MTLVKGSFDLEEVATQRSRTTCSCSKHEHRTPPFPEGIKVSSYLSRRQAEAFSSVVDIYSPRACSNCVSFVLGTVQTTIITSETAADTCQEEHKRAESQSNTHELFTLGHLLCLTFLSGNNTVYPLFSYLVIKIISLLNMVTQDTVRAQ